MNKFLMIMVVFAALMAVSNAIDCGVCYVNAYFANIDCTNNYSDYDDLLNCKNNAFNDYNTCLNGCNLGN